MIYGAGRAYLGSVGLAAAFGSADPQPPVTVADKHEKFDVLLMCFWVKCCGMFRIAKVACR